MCWMAQRKETMSKMTAQNARPPAKYRRTERELVGLIKLARAQRIPRLTVSKQGHLEITPEHPDKLARLAVLMDALGTADLDFFNGFCRQLANAGSQGPEFEER